MDDLSVRSISTTTDPFGFLRNRQNPPNHAQTPSAYNAEPIIESSLTNEPIVPSTAKENHQPYSTRSGNANRTVGKAHSRIFQNAAPAMTSASPQIKHNRNQRQTSRPPLRPTAAMADAENSGSASVTLISITPPAKAMVPSAARNAPQTTAVASKSAEMIGPNVDLIESFNKTSSPIRMAATRNDKRWDFSTNEEHGAPVGRRGSMGRNDVLHSHTSPNQKEDATSHYQPSILSPLSELSHSPASADVYNSDIKKNATSQESQPHLHSMVFNRISNENQNNGIPLVSQRNDPNRKSDHTSYTEDPPASLLDSTMSTVLASPYKRTTVVQQPTTVISQSSSSSVMTQVLHQKRLQNVTMELQQTQNELYRVQREHEESVKQLDDTIQECSMLRNQREKDIAAALQKAQQDHEKRMQDVLARYEQDWMELQTTVAELEQEHLQREQDLTQWHNDLQNQQSALEEQHRLLDERRQQENATYQRRIVGAEQRLEQQTVLLEQREMQIQQQEEQIRQQRHALQEDQMKLEESVKEFHQKQKNYEDQYSSMEEAIQALVQQRQEAEACLQEAVQQRQDYMQQTENIQTESQKKILTLQDEIQDGTIEVQKIQQQILDSQNELVNLKQRIRVLVEADQSSRQATAAATAKADQNLTAILSQLEVAQRERDSVLDSIAQQKQEYLHMQEQMAKEEVRWQNEQNLLNQKILDLEKLRKTAQDEIDAMMQSANEDIVTRTKSLDDQIEKSNIEMQQRTKHLEQLQLQLDEAICQHESQVTMLRQNELDYQKRHDELHQRITDFTKIEHREQRLRIELERKVERLTNLIQTERTDHSNKLKSIDAKVKDMKQQHQQALHDWTVRLSSLEAERDEKQMDVETLQQSLVDRDSTISLLKQEVYHLQEELSDVSIRFQQVEDREQQDLDKIRDFMERLEAQASALEEQEERNEADRQRLDALQLDYQDRVDQVNKEREEIIAECKKQAQDHQKGSLIALLNQPWRQEQSGMSLSDAFSKWVRETLFQVIDEDEEFARNQLLDIERHVENLQFQCNEAQRIRSETVDLLERERNAKRELQNQIRFHREKEQQLYEDIQCLSREKQERHRRRRESKIFSIDNDDTIIDEDSLIHREAAVARKEEFLERMEVSIQEKERQIAEANDRIRMMASQLRQKETDLETKEALLTSQQNSM